MAFAAEELRDYASLPQNPGRELRRVLWPLWMEKNPRHRARADGRGCDNCRDSVAGPGFFFVREPDGYVVCLKCVCCEHDVSFARTWTLAEIYAAGLEPDLRNMSASRGDSGYAHEDARLPPEQRDMRPEAVSAGKVAESLGLF